MTFSRRFENSSVELNTGLVVHPTIIFGEPWEFIGGHYTIIGECIPYTASFV